MIHDTEIWCQYRCTTKRRTRHEYVYQKRTLFSTS